MRIIRYYIETRIYDSNFLSHHGILGMKWGERNGPPYPLSGGAYSPSEKRQYKRKRLLRNSIYNKKHFDETLDANKTKLSTLSYDKNRTKNADMFYATHDFFDKHYYIAAFNKPVPKELYDDNGNNIGTGMCLKYKIDNALKNNIKVASEDSGAEVFRQLYKNDRDFYNFVTDDNRMESYFVTEKYKFKGYREAREALHRMNDKKYVPTSDDLQKVYRIFNYVIPYSGDGNARKGHDVVVQRAKFFTELKKLGYGAVLDTNDAIYGGYKAKSPIIVFDMEQIIPDDVYETEMADKYFSSIMLVGRKVLNL